MKLDSELARMVDQMKHLLGPDHREDDFVMPSLLKEVPSFTSTESVPRQEVITRAELGRSSS